MRYAICGMASVYSEPLYGGGGEGYTDIFLGSFHIYITNVHIPVSILIVHKLSIAGRLTTLK